MPAAYLAAHLCKARAVSAKLLAGLSLATCVGRDGKEKREREKEKPEKRSTTTTTTTTAATATAGKIV